MAKRGVRKKGKGKPKGKQLAEKKQQEEKYFIELDGARARIVIRKVKGELVYELELPQVGIATKALLEEVRKELVGLQSFSPETDEAKLAELKKRFREIAKKLLKDKLPGLRDEHASMLIGLLMQEMLGLGKLEFVLADQNLEEVVVLSAKEPIRVYHRKYGWLKTNLYVESEEQINNYANIIARRVGRQITVLNPLLDAHLLSGDRANAVLYPISTKGHTLTIRKFSRDPWTIVDLIKNNTITAEVAALIWLAIEYEMNIIVSGGTASGKTVFLNACMPFMPPNQRIVSIEDTRELTLPEFLYWCPLVTRTPNPEGKGEVTMLDLLINSLRMRPDRIILGEIRRQREAEVLFASQGCESQCCYVQGQAQGHKTNVPACGIRGGKGGCYSKYNLQMATGNRQDSKA